MKNDRGEELMMKVEMPLSSASKVILIIDGDTDLNEACFLVMHEVVDLMQTALLGGKKPNVIEQIAIDTMASINNRRNAPEPPREKKERHLKKLPACSKHPQSGRNAKTNRCIECFKEQSQKMIASIGKTEAVHDETASTALKPAGEDLFPTAEEEVGVVLPVLPRYAGHVGKPFFPHESIPVSPIVEKPQAEVVWSVPTRCPKCGAGMVRVHHLATADVQKDCWIHDRSVAAGGNCFFKISHFKIRVDKDYRGAMRTV